MGDWKARFEKEATKWLGVWLDSTLSLVENQRRCINRARQAEGRIQGLVNKHGIPPTSAKNLQTAVIQGTLLNASELALRRSKSKAKEMYYQRMISKMGKASIGAVHSTPLGIVIAETKLTPSGPLLDFRKVSHE